MKMNDKQIVRYVENFIIDNLAKNNSWIDIAEIKSDETNEILIQHIDSLMSLFVKAKEILEKKGGKE